MIMLRNYFFRIETVMWFIPLALLFLWPQLLTNLFNSNYMPHVHKMFLAFGLFIIS